MGYPLKAPMRLIISLFTFDYAQRGPCLFGRSKFFNDFGAVRDWIGRMKQMVLNGATGHASYMKSADPEAIGQIIVFESSTDNTFVIAVDPIVVSAKERKVRAKNAVMSSSMQKDFDGIDKRKIEAVLYCAFIATPYPERNLFNPPGTHVINGYSFGQFFAQHNSSAR